MRTSVPVSMTDDGVLWLINRTVFHPRGFSLGLDSATGEFVLHGDGSEPWAFADGGGLSELEKFTAIEGLLQRARERNENN